MLVFEKTKNRGVKAFAGVFTAISLSAIFIYVTFAHEKPDSNSEAHREEVPSFWPPNEMVGAHSRPLLGGNEVPASDFLAPFTTTRDGWTFYADPEGGMTLFGWEWLGPIKKGDWFNFAPLTAEYSLENVPAGQSPGGIYKGDLIEGFEIVQIRQNTIDFMYPSGNMGSWNVAILETTSPSFVVAMYLQSEFNRTFCANTKNGPRPVTSLRELNTEYDNWDVERIKPAEIIGIPPCLDR